MGGSSFLQIFLMIDVFLIGVGTALAARHAYAHFKPHKQVPDNAHQVSQTVKLPAGTRDRLLEAAQANYQNILNRSAADFEHSLGGASAELAQALGTTTRGLNDLLKKLGAEVIESELARYRQEIAELRKQAETNISGAATEIDKYKAELKAALDQEIIAEKQRIVKQIDAKLADAVASFLMETLPHNVDLGAQSAYLTSMLEEHKADFTRGVNDES